MSKRTTILKVLAETCRVLIGVVFLFSGFVKAVDPMGGAIKIGEYLTSFGLQSLRTTELLLSFNLSAAEFTLGACMLLGAYRRYTSLLSLLFMAFMTPLTLYLALNNPVSDCGCFGDALVLTNWETFGKNVVLLAAALFAFRHNQKLLPCYTYKVYWFVALYAYIFSVGFAYRNYNHLPLIDFRPYKVGTNIPEGMAIPEGAPADEYRYSFIYEKEGVKREFTLDNLPTSDSTWHYVDSKTELLKEGYHPPISGFALFDETGTEQTQAILSHHGPLLLLIAPKLEEADDEHIDEINGAYDYALENQLPFYCLTGSSPEAILRWSDMTGAEYPFLTADEVVLKTIIRANPGLLLLQWGTILAKWHYNDIPQEEDWTRVIGQLLHAVDTNKKEEGGLTTNLFTFTVPLLLVWLYDLGINRRKRKRAPAQTEPPKPEQTEAGEAS